MVTGFLRIVCSVYVDNTYLESICLCGCVPGDGTHNLTFANQVSYATELNPWPFSYGFDRKFSPKFRNQYVREPNLVATVNSH